jgi:hypothetical protein
MCNNNWLSFGWSNDSTIWVSSATGNKTGEIYLNTTYLKETFIIVCRNFTTKTNGNDDYGFTVFPNPAHDILKLTISKTCLVPH